MLHSIGLIVKKENKTKKKVLNRQKSRECWAWLKLNNSNFFFFVIFVGVGRLETKNPININLFSNL